MDRQDSKVVKVTLKVLNVGMTTHVDLRPLCQPLDGQDRQYDTLMYERNPPPPLALLY